MSLIGNMFGSAIKFGKGGVLGATLGTAVGLLVAPGKGAENRAALSDRIQQSRLAAADARAGAEQDIINRFRSAVNDTSTLKEEEFASKNAHISQVAHVEATKPEF